MRMMKEKEERSFEIFSSKEDMMDIINQFREEECEVPEIVLLLFDVSKSEMKKLHKIGVKTILHSPSKEEVLGIQKRVMNNILDDCEESIKETLIDIKNDMNQRFEKLSDSIYEKIYSYDGYVPPSI